MNLEEENKNPYVVTIFTVKMKCVLLQQSGGVSKSFRTGCLERELQMVQLSATRCSCIAIL